MNSFWHNGCTIFGCTEDNGNPLFRVLDNEIMYWPKGHYSLIMPKEGCPSDIEHKWRNSSVLHFGDGENFVSDIFDLYGNYTEMYFEHFFCTHIEPEEEDLTFIPRYQTYWDQGQYCILRKNSNCPEGFESGVVKFDDRTRGVPYDLTTYPDWLPDGFYMGDTVLTFCCRSDGKVEEPIILPKEHPFVLFMVSGSNECQEVRGMSYELEYFYFDNAEAAGEPYKIGTVPQIKDDDNNTLLYFCYYKPFECGCKGHNGKRIKIGANYTSECILYKCITVDGKPFLDLLRGGCPLNGKCINENSTWTETSGEKCYVKTCSRVVNAARGYKFEVKTQYQGCKDDKECRRIGYQKTRGCYGMVCSLYGRFKEPYFRLQKQGCSNGKGGCVSLGEKFKRGCITYRCRKEPNKCDLELVSAGCSHNGKCHDVNSTWDIGCTTAKCNMVKQGKSFLLKLEPVGRKCQFKNKCYGVGKTAKDGCNEYFCNKFNDTDYRMDIKKGGCFINNKCHDVNATWKEGCITFQCKWEKTKFQHIFRKSVHSMGCPWKNKCFEPNEIETDQCISRRCISKVENNRYSAQMKETSAACFDKISGTCVALGEAVERDCVKFNCTRANPKSFPYLKSIGRGCKVNGVCMQKGTKWTDKEQCADFECKDHPKYGIPFPQRVRGGCKMNGVCKSVNESEENGCYKHICKEFKKNGQMYYGIEKRPNGINLM
ncbi:hypothetical protein KUTeg_019530 [Tegillarca granosa]|uniref:Apextrin C-terminal domain-containing protein n=1 Tax=Tegillarca granosa TaxID=220873 RepID=A0ABQ9EEV8_TEGGR|nr:hypothetical protein KUTeg_019530 [Tegillarca granosa]